MKVTLFNKNFFVLEDSVRVRKIRVDSILFIDAPISKERRKELFRTADGITYSNTDNLLFLTLLDGRTLEAEFKDYELLQQFYTNYSNLPL